jgi:hypothetical protein
VWNLSESHTPGGGMEPEYQITDYGDHFLHLLNDPATSARDMSPAAGGMIHRGRRRAGPDRLGRGRDLLPTDRTDRVDEVVVARLKTKRTAAAGRERSTAGQGAGCVVRRS